MTGHRFLAAALPAAFSVGVASIGTTGGGYVPKGGRIVVALIATALVAGCKGIPQDDRYQIHDGGRSNNRAEAPAIPLPTGTATAELSTAQ